MLHTESAPGQLEIVLVYQEDPVQLADNVVLARETITAVTFKHGLKALFLPKINANHAGNGRHVHLSIRDTETGSNLFHSSGSHTPRRQSFLMGMTMDISSAGQSFIEGILRHLPALLALTISQQTRFVELARVVGLGIK
jgi:glutamine synthetase